MDIASFFAHKMVIKNTVIRVFRVIRSLSTTILTITQQEFSSKIKKNLIPEEPRNVAKAR